MFDSVAATSAERAAARPGDELVAHPDVVMDRAFSLDAPPAAVWPWIVQLGKGRAGWYLPAPVERALPRRALRHLNDRWTSLTVGDVVPDYGGKRASFTVAAIAEAQHLVYRSQRHGTSFTWSISLEPVAAGTRVLLRLRIAPVKRRWLARLGDAFDAATIAGLAAGLRERVG